MEENEQPAYFGDWLRLRRKSLDLTQEELAQRAGCTVFAVRKIETGVRRPSKQLAELLAKALEIPQDIQQNFIRVARGEVNVERLPLPSLDSKPVVEERPRVVSNQLPVYFSPLVGREVELAAVARIFDDPQCRLLTLTGLGGIGKTRLAAEFASTYRSQFPGGVFFVSLAAVNSAELIVPAIADALQLLFSGPIDPKEQLVLHIERNLNRPGLFVLDNMEHLLPSESLQTKGASPTDLLSDMLQRLPQVSFLVTSRERLNLRGEWVYELHGLPVPPPIFEEKLADYSAPVLFLQSARRFKPDFAVTKADQPALVRICQLLEGIPLAIELAATWVGMLSCHEIADEIEANIDFLSSSTRDIPERHRSLRATFDHSWQLLSSGERNVLCQLSIFRGGFSREAAALIVKATLPLLASLVSKSLVRRNENGRYDLHEVIRQFTLGCLLSEPYNRGVRDLHCHYYLSYIAEREAALKSVAQQEALRELVLEIENIRAAWIWAIEHEKFHLISAAIRGLSWFFETTGLLTEGIEQFEMLVSAVKGREPTSEQQRVLGQALTQQSLLVFRRGLFDQAQKLQEESLELLRPYGEPALLIDALVFLGIICHLTGQVERARDLMEEGLTCARASKDEWFTAYAIHNLGYIASLNGNYLEGYAGMMAGIDIWRRIGDPHSISLGLNFMSPTLIRLGRFAEAERCLHESLTLCLHSRNRWGIGTAYRYQGLAKLAQGKPEEAQPLLKKSLEVLIGYTVGWDIALTLIYLGSALSALGNVEEAETSHRNAIQTATAANTVPLVLEALVGLAEVQMKRGEFASALRLAGFAENHLASTFATKDSAARLVAEIQEWLPFAEVQTAKAEVQGQSLQAILLEA